MAYGQYKEKEKAMINEEKVILMTKIAMYKESLGKEDLEKGKYFQSDYVKLNCLKTIVSSTVLFVVVAVAYGFEVVVFPYVVELVFVVLDFFPIFTPFVLFFLWFSESWLLSWQGSTLIN